MNPLTNRVLSLSQEVYITNVFRNLSQCDDIKMKANQVSYYN